MGRPRKTPKRKHPENHSRPYSEEEIIFIQESAGSATLDFIANRLGRTKSGVKSKMIELGCFDFHMEAGTYSANALSELIGVSYETVRRWILTKGLPAKKKGREYNVDEKFQSYHIEIPRFWKWAEQNKNLIEFNKIEPDILPPEPEWVEKERRKQFYKPAKQKIWTTEEDRTLLDLYYKQGMKQRLIAEKLGRTQGSIEKRLKRLRESK